MGLNKKGILFSIISLLIATLIITIFTVEIQNDFETEMALLTSRTESFESTFDVIQLNIGNMLEITGKEALIKLTGASNFLYNNNTQTSYDLDLQCEFENLMVGNNITVYSNDPYLSFNGYTMDIVGIIPGVYEGDLPSCQSSDRDAVKLNDGIDLIQGFVAQGNLATDKIKLTIAGPPGDSITIQILDECKNVLSEVTNNFKVIGFFECGDTGAEYTLNNRVVYEKGRKYYIRLSTDSIGGFVLGIRDDLTGITSADATNQTKNDEILDASYGYDPSISPSLTDFLDDVEVFMEDIYHVDMNYSIERLDLTQDDPWSIVVEGDVKVSFDDGSIILNKLIPFSRRILLEGMSDPMFAKYREERIIVRDIPKVEAELVFEDFVNLTLEGDYLKDSLSPKYIDRFSSNHENSRCCGMFSVINTENWTAVTHEHDIVVASEDLSVVDWHFLPRKEFCIAGGTEIGLVEHDRNIDIDDFILDERTMAKFNITNTSVNINEIIEKCP